MFGAARIICGVCCRFHGGFHCLIDLGGFLRRVGRRSLHTRLGLRGHIRSHRRGGNLRELGLDRRGRALRRMHFGRAMPVLVRAHERIAALHRVRIVEFRGDRGLVMHNEPAPLALRALLGERLDEPLPDSLARHLHESERRHLGHLVLGAVAGQAFHQTTQHEVTVRRHHHIHIVDHDHATDVAQTQLTCDLLARLQIASCHRLLERLALANEPAGVHVDRRHRLGAVDHN